MKRKRHWAMADAGNPEQLILATQAAFVEMLKGILEDTAANMPGIPGLTWDQIYYFLDQCAEKKPEIIHQPEVF